MSDTLPPLVQEYRANAEQLLAEQRKVKSSTKDMVDETDRETSRMGKMFGGVAKAAAGLAIGIASAAAATVGAIVKTGIQEAKDASAMNAQLEAGIKSTGNAAGVTVEGMNALAASIQAYSGQTDDSIAQTQALLLTFTNIRNIGADKIFDRTTKAAADMAARLGGDAASQAMQLGKALNDPIDGVSKLTRVGVQFTDAQKEQIRVMQEAGDIAGAQKVILEELERQFGGSAEAAGKSLPGAIERAKRSFEDLSQSVVEKFLPIVTPAVNGLVTAFQTAAPYVEAGAGRIADALMAIPNAIEIVKGAFTGLGSEVDLGALNGPLQTFGQTLRTLADAAKPILDSIMSGFAQLAPVFAPIIGQLLQLYTSFSPLAVILQAIMPVLPQLVDAFVQLGVAVGGALGTALTTLIPIVTEIAGLLSGQLAKIVTTLAPVVAQLAQSLGGLLGSALEAVMPAVMQLAQFVGDLLTAVLPLIDPILQLVMAFVPLIDPIVKLVSTLLGPLISMLMQMLDPVMQIVNALVSFLAPAIQVIVEGLAQNLIPIIDGVVQVLGGVIDFLVGVFTGDWEKAWQGIIGIFTGIWSTVKGVVAAAVNGVIDLINGVIAGINGLASGINDATGGAIDLRIPDIPRVSFDVGTNRVPGPTGAPLPSVLHGGEVVLSNDMIAGRAPLPPRAVEAVERQRAGTFTGSNEPTVVNNNVTVNASTNASPQRIARDVGWELRRAG